MPGRTPFSSTSFGNRILLRFLPDNKQLNTSTWTNMVTPPKEFGSANDVGSIQPSNIEDTQSKIKKKLTEENKPLLENDLSNDESTALKVEKVQEVRNQVAEKKSKFKSSLEDLLSIVEDVRQSEKHILQTHNNNSSDDAVTPSTSSVKYKTDEIVSIEDKEILDHDVHMKRSDKKELEKVMLSFPAEEPTSTVSTDADSIFFPLETAASGTGKCPNIEEAKILEKYARIKVCSEEFALCEAKVLVTEGRLDEFNAKLRARRARIDERHANLCMKRGIIKEAEERLKVLESQINTLEEDHKAREDEIRNRERKAKQMENYIQLQKINLKKREEKIEEGMENLERRRRIVEQKESLTSIMNDIMTNKEKEEVIVPNKSNVTFLPEEKNCHSSSHNITTLYEDIDRKENSIKKQQAKDTNTILDFFILSHDSTVLKKQQNNQRKRSNSYETKVFHSTGQTNSRNANSTNLSAFSKSKRKSVMGLWL